MAYVEVKAKTVELAIDAAAKELGIAERDRLQIQIIQEPERGFLGFGGQDAIVRVEERRDSGKSKKSRRGKGQSGGSSDQRQRKPQARSQGNQGKSQASQGGGKGGRSGRSGQGSGNTASKGRSGRSAGDKGNRPKKVDDREEVSVGDQEPMVRDFLAGLVSAFGLEGRVETRVDDDIVIADVVGEQTEALVGTSGAVMEAVHELTKTMLQRTVQDSARVRIDIAGYAERRRQALTIYAGELIDQVLEDGGELMLEPMSASDRKVIHDAVAARQGVRSYSEGEAPKRYVVIALDESDQGDSSEEE